MSSILIDLNPRKLTSTQRHQASPKVMVATKKSGKISIKCQFQAYHRKRDIGTEIKSQTRKFTITAAVRMKAAPRNWAGRCSPVNFLQGLLEVVPEVLPGSYRAALEGSVPVRPGGFPSLLEPLSPGFEHLALSLYWCPGRDLNTNFTTGADTRYRNTILPRGKGLRQGGWCPTQPRLPSRNS